MAIYVYAFTAVSYFTALGRMSFTRRIVLSWYDCYMIGTGLIAHH